MAGFYSNLLTKNVAYAGSRFIRDLTPLRSAFDQGAVLHKGSTAFLQQPTGVIYMIHEFWQRYPCHPL